MAIKHGRAVEHSGIEVQTDLIEKALESVVTGSSFRASHQCQALLRYIVEHSVAHHDEMLRERVIGVNVFGRAPDYDTGNDPVVRARAAEVRKRLAQHYLHDDRLGDDIRIEIPSGAYRAVFATRVGTGNAGVVLGSLRQEVDADSEIRAGEHPSLKEVCEVEQVNISPPMTQQGVDSNWPRWLLGTALAAIVLVTVGLLVVRQGRPTESRAFGSFWAPALNAKQPVLIFIGANYTYNLTKSFLDEYREQHHMEDAGQEFFIDLKPGLKINESDLSPTHELIGFGDVAAAARMASMLTRLNKSYDLRYGGDITVTDLQANPTILIGGFSNAWTLEVMRQLPFRLVGGDRIVESGDKFRVWTRNSTPGTFSGDDYAVVSRLIKSETGNFVLAIAGIDTYSNQAAADFLNNSNRISALLRTLPEGWEQKNMQIVLHATVVKQVPVVANVETVKVW